MNRREFIRILSLAGLLLPFTRSASAWVPDFRSGGERKTLISRSVFAMGSVFQIYLFTPDETAAWQDLKKISARLRALENLWSVFLPDSDLSKVNAAAGTGAVQVNPLTLHLLQESQKLNTLTGGLFDPTIEPVMRAFGFRSDPESLISFPSDRELAVLDSAIGIKNLILKGNTVTLNHRLSGLDPGGIGCGLALDDTVSFLRSAGYDQAFLNFSGDVYALGSGPEENGWPVEIVNPDHPEANETLLLTNLALSTSGAYENRRSNGRISWGHIMNPEHRKPSEPVKSVSVVAKTACLADGLSTAGFLRPDLLPEWKSERLLSDFRVLT